jgi:LacI family transcriptional regulator
MLADHQVDGIVAVSPLIAPDRLEALAARVPVVMLGRHAPTTAYDTVTGDHAEGTRLVMEHLFGLGHRRIAMLAQEEQVQMPGTSTPQEARVEQYIERMRRAGLAGAAPPRPPPPPPAAAGRARRGGGVRGGGSNPHYLL